MKKTSNTIRILSKDLVVLAQKAAHASLDSFLASRRETNSQENLGLIITKDKQYLGNINDADPDSILLFALVKDSRVGSHEDLVHALLESAQPEDPCYSALSPCLRHNARWSNSPMCEHLIPRQKQIGIYQLRAPIEAIKYEGISNCRQVHEFLKIQHQGDCATEMIDLPEGVLEPGMYVIKENGYYSLHQEQKFEKQYKIIKNEY